MDTDVIGIPVDVIGIPVDAIGIPVDVIGIPVDVITPKYGHFLLLLQPVHIT